MTLRMLYNALLLLTIFAPFRAVAQDYKAGEWISQENFDAITDEKMVVSGAATTNGLIILFQCKGPVVAAIIKGYTNMVKMEFIVIDERSEVLWRVDKEPFHRESWQVGREKASRDYFLINIDGREMVSAIREASDTLTFRAHGLTGKITTAGAPDQMDKILTGCS